jgi:hypothetical protein
MLQPTFSPTGLAFPVGFGVAARRSNARPNSGAAGALVNRKPLTIGLIVLGVVLLVVAVVYFTTPANSLPGFFPGHSDTETRHHVKHGIAFVLLAAASFAGAWFAAAPSTQPS